MLAPGTRWTLNSRVALGIRHIDFILWLWKLILKDNPEKPTLFSPLALDRKKKKKTTGKGKQISALFLPASTASKSSLPKAV